VVYKSANILTIDVIPITLKNRKAGVL